jgi:hypothetical protein
MSNNFDYKNITDILLSNRDVLKNTPNVKNYLLRSVKKFYNHNNEPVNSPLQEYHHGDHVWIEIENYDREISDYQEFDSEFNLKSYDIISQEFGFVRSTKIDWVFFHDDPPRGILYEKTRLSANDSLHANFCVDDKYCLEMLNKRKLQQEKDNRQKKINEAKRIAEGYPASNIPEKKITSDDYLSKKNFHFDCYKIRESLYRFNISFIGIDRKNIILLLNSENEKMTINITEIDSDFSNFNDLSKTNNRTYVIHNMSMESIPTPDDVIIYFCIKFVPVLNFLL